MTDAHRDSQRAFTDCVYNTCHQTHELLPDPVVRYLVSWRLRTAMERLLKTPPEVQTWDKLSAASICGGVGLEGSLLIDAGLTPVFVSDLSAKGVRAAITRDHRLMGFAADAEERNSLGLVWHRCRAIREPGKGERQTTVANLAVTLAHAGHRPWYSRVIRGPRRVSDCSAVVISNCLAARSSPARMMG
jgi:hypothetical protein